MRTQLAALVFVVWVSPLSSAVAQPAWLYGVDERELFQINPSTGGTVRVGRTAENWMRMHDVAVTPDGTIYAITPDSLLKVNPMTGLVFEVGSLHLSGRANALAADRLGRLFGATESGSLFEVNPSTGQARMIGGFGPEILSEGDLAFAPDGTLFGTSHTSLLLRIDVTTGQATVIGDLKFKQLEGLAFDADGRLYGSSTDATLLSIDTSTGTAVQVGVFNNSVHMNGLAMAPVVNLRATTNGLTLALAWDAMGSTLSYVLEAGSGPGLSDLHRSDIGNVTTLTATAPPGTYFLRMRARTATGVGLPSNEVRVMLGSDHCASPSTPTGFTASVRRNTLTLEWNATPGASSYHLEAGTGPGLANAYSSNVGSSTTLEFDLAGVPRLLYYLRLRAIASCGLGSNPIEIVFDRR